VQHDNAERPYRTHYCTTRLLSAVGFRERTIMSTAVSPRGPTAAAMPDAMLLQRASTLRQHIQDNHATVLALFQRLSSVRVRCFVRWWRPRPLAAIGVRIPERQWAE
jgi:hypothetical protein